MQHVLLSLGQLDPDLRPMPLLTVMLLMHQLLIARVLTRALRAIEGIK